jgi:plasmid stabilization system protein ParE
MLHLELHAEADRELSEAAAYLEAERSGYGERFLTLFREKCDLLCAFPQMGHRAGAAVRTLSIGVFRYNIIYEQRGDILFVLALAHQCRRPAYWAARR